MLDLLTPVDLIKKSSCDGVKRQKQAPAQAEPAADKTEEAAKPAVAGKKTATRGRNANLQVVDIEPKFKQGKRKATAGNAQQPVTDLPSDAVPEGASPASEALLPNRKRAKQSKSAASEPAAVETAPDPAQPDGAAATFKEVPGLPGVKHKMPQISSAPAVTVAAATVQPSTSPKAARKAAAQGPRQPGTAKSGSSNQQGAAETAAQSSSAGGAADKAFLTAAVHQHGAAAGPQVIDKPADKMVAAAQQSTLASGSDAQAAQFQTLQVSIARTCAAACC